MTIAAGAVIGVLVLLGVLTVWWVVTHPVHHHKFELINSQFIPGTQFRDQMTKIELSNMPPGTNVVDELRRLHAGYTIITERCAHLTCRDRYRQYHLEGDVESLHRR